MAEQYQNLAASTTAGSIDNSTNPVTFSVHAGDGTLFPATTNGSFRVVVSNSDGTSAEVMLVTSRSTDSFTASRGSNTNETPTPTLFSHSSSSIIQHVITANGMKSIISDMLYGDPLTTPTTSTFGTASDSGTATGISFTNDSSSGEQGVILQASSTSNDTNICARMMSVPAAPYNMRMRFRFTSPDANQFPLAGLCWSDGTKFALFGLFSRNAIKIRTTTFSNNTSFNGTYDVEKIPWGGFPGRAGLYDIYVSDDNTNRICRIVGTGIKGDAIVFDSHARTTYFTPTLIGIFVAPGSNSDSNFAPIQIKVIDWTQS